MRRTQLVSVVAAGTLLGGCAAPQAAVGTDVAFDAGGEDCAETPADAEHPDVLAIEFGRGIEGWSIGAWVCSPYDSPERYADAWRVLDQDGNVLATRELTHPHADEQPFLRALSGPLAIAPSVTHLTIEARDSVNGWGGRTVTEDIRASAIG